MHDQRSHLRLTKMLFPNYNDDTIMAVNKRIDNPMPQDMAFVNAMQSLMGNQFGSVPGMNRSGHRKYNHDLFSAMLQGYMIGGQQGATVAMNHLIQDTFNDQMVKMLGPDMANMLESAFLVSTNKRKQRPMMWDW